MSRDSENDQHIIDDRIPTPTEKPVSKRLFDLESETKTDIEKIKEDLGKVSEKTLPNFDR